MGDFVANAIAVTPEREQRFAFSVSIQTNATRIVVSGPGFRSFSTLDELAGKEIFVTLLTVAYQELRRLNDSLQSDFVYKMIQLASRGGSGVHKPLASLHRPVRVWTSSVKLRRNLLTLQLLGRLGFSVGCTSQQVSPRTQIVTCPLRVRNANPASAAPLPCQKRCRFGLIALNWRVAGWQDCLLEVPPHSWASPDIPGRSCEYQKVARATPSST